MSPSLTRLGFLIPERTSGEIAGAAPSGVAANWRLGWRKTILEE
jgi:hypothetical protein